MLRSSISQSDLPEQHQNLVSKNLEAVKSIQPNSCSEPGKKHLMEPEIQILKAVMKTQNISLKNRYSRRLHSMECRNRKCHFYADRDGFLPNYDSDTACDSYDTDPYPETESDSSDTYFDPDTNSESSDTDPYPETESDSSDTDFDPDANSDSSDTDRDPETENDSSDTDYDSSFEDLEPENMRIYFKNRCKNRDFYKLQNMHVTTQASRNRKCHFYALRDHFKYFSDLKKTGSVGPKKKIKYDEDGPKKIDLNKEPISRTFGKVAIIKRIKRR